MRERAAPAHGEIGAQQGARLHVDRAHDVGRVGVDGDERGDADRDRRHREHEAPPRGARVAPRERGKRAPAIRHPGSHAARTRSSTIEPVAQTNDSPRAGGELHVVRHDDHRRIRVAIELLEKLHDANASGVVEIARGLVGEEHARRVDERACDGHALLLAPGEANGIVVCAVGEPDACEQIGGACERSVVAAKIEWNAHVLECRERGNELKALEHEPNFLTTQPRARVFAQAGEVDVVEQHGSCAWSVEAGEQAEQRRLAAARRSHNGDELAVCDREAHVAQHGDRSIAAGK